ncbi:MAG: GIY-YIG nuclease family protein [Bacteroidota bacterium]
MAKRANRKYTSPVEPSVRTSVSALPDSPGVYIFYGTEGNLLYVGKSVAIRTRVRSHFVARKERGMCKQIRHVEARATAGELGALLLESQLIKQLQPSYNKRSRQKHRIIVARRAITSLGYLGITLEAISHIDPADAKPIMGVFKTTTQAKEYLASTTKSHRLCAKLLGLEQTSRFCFSYHLHQCNGACMGLEPPASYNARVEQAFEERRIKAWPFKGAVIIEEKDDERGEVFVVDNWCLLYSFTFSLRSPSLSVRGLHRFDYDSYKILAGYVFDEANAHRIRHATKDEIDLLLSRARAA